MKKWILFSALFVSVSGFGQSAPGDITGTVIDAKTKEIIYGATVFVMDSERKYQDKTNEEGRFRITAIPAGDYMLNIKFNQDTMRDIPVKVTMDGITQLGEIAFSGIVELKGVTVKGNTVKLIDGFLPIKQLTGEDIEKSSQKFSVVGLVTSNNSDVRMTDDGDLVFRGARKGDMIYMVDGIKGREVSNLPSCAIGRMMVYTGGLPAKYGDTLGGAIVIETKSYFDLYREWEREQMKKD